ncbi:MAG: NAD(+) diphosphatase [Candidatus Dormibacteraceae bacterium]
MPQPGHDHFRPEIDTGRRPGPGSLIFAFHDERLPTGESTAHPGALTLEELARSRISLRYEPLYVGVLEGRDCFAAAAAPDVEAGAPTLALRELIAGEGALGLAAGRAWQINQWYLDHAHCGRCGSGTTMSARELCRTCGSCGTRHYPRVSPAVIVRVDRGDSILLAHRKNSAGAVYSLLAGFVEPGETLEQAVAREVREEVGVDVAEVHYASSQPWPFPGQLMIGFRAERDGGEVAVDGVEIDDAGWFTRGSLPELPPPYSISRRLIDEFFAGR